MKTDETAFLFDLDGTEELERAGAYRVFEDPADLLDHLDEAGGRP